MLLTWRETKAATARTVVHAIALDSFEAIDAWKLRSAANTIELESPDRAESWSLAHSPDAPEIQIVNPHTGQAWRVQNQGKWTLEAST